VIEKAAERTAADLLLRLMVWVAATADLLCDRWCGLPPSLNC
jgi:hypothetical protein